MKHLEGVVPPVARIPLEDEILAEFSCPTEDNFIYIKIQSPPTRNQRLMLLGRLYNEYGMKRKVHLAAKDIHIGMYVVIKKEERFGTYYYRAIVVRKDEFGVIYCFRIDEGNEVLVLSQHVYRITPEIMKTEVLALKCCLDGMNIFDSLPHLKMVYKLVQMSNLDPEPHYPTKIVCIMNGVPVIRMQINDTTLTNQVQRWVSSFCLPRQPKVGDTISAEVVHVDGRGRVWFHPNDGHNLVRRIQGTLMNLDISTFPKAFDPSQKDKFNAKDVNKMDEWKKKYFTVPTGVYISKFEDDGLLYRAMLKRSIDKERVQVEFIDFGNCQIVSRRELINCKDVDENLAYIPPQCIVGHMAGFVSLHEKRFWQHVAGIVDIKILDEGEGDNGLELELFRPGVKSSINELMSYGKKNRKFKADVNVIDKSQRA